MGMTDPIADMLTRLRNSAMAYHETVDIPYSKLKESLATVLVKEGYLSDAKRMKVDGQAWDMLRVQLKFDQAHRPVFSSIQRVSRPGRRVYLGYRDIHPLRGGLGVHVFSTPQGVMVDRDAVKAKVGGELMCSVC